ncbi:MAG: DUF177 domain-containing protein [Amylibacter sp.]|nr:DUF177 domain-containing protein [Amylibacter sp.]
MSDISDKLPIKSNIITISQLSQYKIHKFSIRFDNNDLLDYKNLLDLRKISKVTIFGEISAEGNKNWLLNAKIGASVTQSCVVTMEDVSTRIDENITRHYFADIDKYDENFSSEEELDADAEGIPDEINLLDLTIESISLNLSDFPRKDGIVIDPVLSAPEGIEPLTDDAVKPFAGLASLRDKLKE